jgi:hypothetical protein
MERKEGSMTNQERLKVALFGNPEREHVDIKFWLGHGLDLTADDLCGEAANMLEQMDATDGDKTFSEVFTQREAATFIG